MENDQLPAIEELVGQEVSLERDSVQNFYRSSFGGINPDRWERANNEILFQDVVAELTGHRDTVIRCPFHGRDRTPSFTLYSRTNDAYCFGCPPGSMLYDNVTFVSKYMELSRVQALYWLEKTFNLPSMPNILVDDEEDEGGISWASGTLQSISS